MTRRGSGTARSLCAELYGCELAMKMFKRTREDLVPQVKDVITAGDFFDLSAGAQIIFT
jgi:peroxiredoxin family protein